MAYYGMLIDKQDQIWMMKDKLGRFDPVTQVSGILKVLIQKIHFFAGVLSLVVDDSGQLWAGTWGDGILKYDGA